MRRTTNVWPNVLGKQPGKKANEALKQLCSENEEPWVVINFGHSAGLLAAFEDRLSIIKTGGNTGFMAGSLGGGRVTEFYYKDITNIEYNSGMLSGVLEVLTASYSGGHTKDYWASGENSPWKQSNTLPLMKDEYKKALPAINEIRERVSKAKMQQVTQIASTPSKADELRRLADLKNQGLLTDDEFAAAKTSLLSD